MRLSPTEHQPSIWTSTDQPHWTSTHQPFIIIIITIIIIIIIIIIGIQTPTLEGVDYLEGIKFCRY